jgi:hypothetical protein
MGHSVPDFALRIRSRVLRRLPGRALGLLRAASCCLACSSSVTASVPISVLSPHALVLLRWIGSA